MKNALYIAFFLCFSMPVFAQNIVKPKTIQEGKNIVITYELKGKGTFEVSVSPSDKGKMTALTGGIGIQKAGKKRIVWNVLQDRPALDASLYFDLKAVFLPINDLINGITSPKKRKKKNN